MSRVSSRTNKGQRTSVKYDEEQADPKDKTDKSGKSVLDPTLISEQTERKPEKSKSRKITPPVDKTSLPDSKLMPKSKAATTGSEEKMTGSLVGLKRKADSQLSSAVALAWDEEEHPEEKRLAAYRPRCSDACK
jgi:hypothetical protein